MRRYVRQILCISWSLIAFPLFSDDVGHRIHNCEIEINMLKNNLQSQEEGRQQLYKEMEESLSSVKKVLKEVESSNAEPKQKMGKSIQTLQTDLIALKEHMNQLATKINELNTSVSNIKKEINAHSASLRSLEEAIGLISKTLTPTGTTSSYSKNGRYVVQSGDSLEKIARKNGMTLSELKELNHLSSSVIRIGQELDVRRSE